MELNLFLDFIGNCVKEINRDVEKLHSDQYDNSNILDHLSSEVIMLENHIQYFSQLNQMPLEDGGPRYFTLEELALYNGKNGSPAYVAVNGVVYDVTNNAVWQGGPHFGLNAGNDLTNEFAGCHPGALVLSVLPVVGYLY
ncbi:cytochrome b5 domain-containing protein [Clostridium sp. Marseille-P2415]|uniref:cytochrome b5 domain-containing protein n=1 Tax=Clostridium sp. Marseille-P2415 TaxID=1805471 RepID=UPI00190EE8AB|nr:cytochrome b5 domain-containing protein [Clostridium sp. Marseille-P2415]